MIGGALFSPDRQHRYKLWRIWDKDEGMCAFIGLNPSTADEIENDPTVRRCMTYARDWGFGGLMMLNIFAFRATDPKVMKAAVDPVGPANDKHLLAEARWCQQVVAGWGTHGAFRDRHDRVLRLLDHSEVDLHCLGKTKDGYPKHPLYLRRDLTAVPFRRGAVLQP